MRTNIPIIILLALTCLVTGCGAQNDNAAVSASVPETIETDNAQPNEETTEIGFTEDNLPELYERRKFVGSALSFTGDWTRTSVHSSLSADISVKDQNEEGFDFTGEFYYYSHMGDAAGRAYFISDNQAIYRQFDNDDIDGEPAYIGFSLDDNGLHVIANGFVEGMGMNVSVTGDYIQDEPYYTNGNVLAENFSEYDLEQLKELLREETYKELFLNNTTIGDVSSEAAKLSDGTIARHIECIVPTMGDGYDLLITEDGRYYFYHANTDLFATNDPDYTDWKIPEYTVATDEAEYDDDRSPFLLWEFEGYVDECNGYYWQDDFKNCDYDGDGKTDRLKRQWNGEEQIAVYTVEFGNGDLLTVPKGWETGFPHVQSGDLDRDGQKEILFTLSYDTSTDPLSFGDMWLFDKDASGRYSEVELPLASGENGAKGFTIDYEEPEDLVIRYSIKEAGLSRSEEVYDDYINYWWTEEKTSSFRSVYWAEIREGKYPAIRCYVEPLRRGGASLGFDLSYRDGKYEIGYVELDAPKGPF